MPVDAGIFSQIQQPQPLNPLAALAQAYQIKAYQGAAEKSELETRSQNALFDLVRGPEFASMPTAKKAAALQGVGAFDQAGKLVTADAAANKDQRAADVSDWELRVKKLDVTSMIAGTVRDQASYDRALGMLGGLGVDTSKFNPTYDPAGVAQFAQATLTAKDRLEAEIKAKTFAETQRHNQATEANSAGALAVSQGNLEVNRDRATSARQTAENGRVPSGYRQNSDGTLTFIPGGPADPSTPKGKGNLTEGQSKSLVYAARMAEANDIFERLAAGPKGDGAGGVTTAIPGSTSPYVGGAITAMSNSENQRLVQAKRDFMTAVLRRESGAVISSDEFASGDQQYFPQVGDSAAVIQQKKRNREIAQRGIAADVPDSDKRISEVRGPRPDSQPKPTAGSAEPPAAAIAYLKANPGMRAQFEAKYGRSAGAYLGQ